MKQCSKCKIKKDVSLFFKHSAKKDGLQSNCKVCHMKTTKAWRYKNPVKYKAYCLGRAKSPKRALKSKLRSRKHRKEMSDKYIRDLITMGSPLEFNDITDEMVDLHRMNLQLKRALKLTPKLKGGED